MNNTTHITTPIYFEHFNKLIEISGGIEQATFLSKIIFHMQNTKIYIDGKSWIVQTREALAEWANISLKKVDRIIKELEGLSLIEKRTLKFKGTPKSHISLSKKCIKLVRNFFEVTKSKKSDKATSSIQQSQKETLESVKKEQSIYKVTKEKVSNNNNTIDSRNSNSLNKDSCNVIFSKKEDLKQTGNQQPNILSDKQMSYLLGTVENLKSQHKCKFTNEPEFIEQAVFAFTNKQQFKGIKSFMHKVNIMASLVRNRKWMTPIGFKRHNSSSSELIDVKDSNQSNLQTQCLKDFSVEIELKHESRGDATLKNTFKNNLADNNRSTELEDRIKKYKAKLEKATNRLEQGIIVDLIKKDQTELFELTR